MKHKLEQPLYPKCDITKAIGYISEHRPINHNTVNVVDSTEVLVLPDAWDREFDIIVDQLIMYERRLPEPTTAEEIIEEIEAVYGYERVAFEGGNFVYYPMSSGHMKNTSITLFGSDLNGYNITIRVSKAFAYKVTAFLIEEEIRNEG